MRISKAVITAAAPGQRSLPLQTLIDHDGREKSVLAILIENALAARIDKVGVVVAPGDEHRFEQALGAHAASVEFIPQDKPLGYGYALLSARGFVGDAPCLHLVGDHLYVDVDGQSSAQRLIEIAEAEECSVSAVQPTREGLLSLFGAVAGRRLGNRAGVYRVDTVAEKPTPTEAEQNLLMSGMRAGHYLCFFGMHVLTPTVFEILERNHRAEPERSLTLSEALAELARREQYLAYETPGHRYNIGVRYGLLYAQVALALNGPERSEILARLVELLAESSPGAAAGSGR